jgi:hypothetical protein
LQQKIHLVEWDSHQLKGGTRMVEIALQEGPLQAVQVHGSTRELLVVLAGLSSTRYSSTKEYQKYQRMILEGLVSVEYFYQ